MKIPLTETLINTKDASRFSGYSSDYLARLVRAKKIKGTKIGHDWFIDEKSLEIFVQEQSVRKAAQAESLSKKRLEEYQKYQTSSTIAHEPRTAAPVRTKEFDFNHVPLRSHVLAFSVAVAVLVSGAMLARAATVSGIGSTTVALAGDASSGFQSMFSGTATQISQQFALVQGTMSETHEHVAQRTRAASADMTSPFLAQLQLATVDLAVQREQQSARKHEASSTNSSVLALSVSNDAHVQPVMLQAYDFAKNPESWSAAAYGAYVAVGQSSYEGILSSFAGYETMIDVSGRYAFSLAVATRDMLRYIPSRITEMNLAMGNVIINTTHNLIQRDVELAYGIANTAPRTAHVSFVFITNLGGFAGHAVATAPALATTVFLNATSLPAVWVPVLAQSTLENTYHFAEGFAHASVGVSARYLALVNSFGSFAYSGTRDAQVFLAQAVPMFSPTGRATVQSAAALESLAPPEVSDLVPNAESSLIGSSSPSDGSVPATESFFASAPMPAAASATPERGDHQ